MIRLWRCLVFSSLILIPTLSVWSAQIVTVALKEDRAPSTPTGAVFDFFYPPVINDRGEVIFRAQLLFGPGGVDVSNDSGVWAGKAGFLFLVSREKGQPPGVPTGAQWGDFFNSSPALNDLGQAGFSMLMQNDPFLIVNSTNNSGIWLGVGTNLTLIAREGSPSTGTPANAFWDNLNLYKTALNNRGHVAFKGNLQQGSGGVDSSNDTGLWSGIAENLELAAREGAEAPTLPIGSTFAILDEPVLNDLGEIAFSATLNVGSGDVTSANNTGIWVGSPTNLIVAAREGSQASGTAAGANFASFERPLINNLGRIAFKAMLKTGAGSVSTTNDAGLWAGNPTNLTLVAREGFQANGLPAGSMFNNLFDFDFNNAGQIAFHANLVIGSGDVGFTNEYAIWAGNPANPRLVVRKGDAAPGVSGGQFGGFNFLELNDVGQVAFQAFLATGGSVTTANDLGIWAKDACGELRLILREGDILQVQPGDFRTVTDFTFFHDPLAGRSFNNQGQLAFSATFADGSRGIFIAETGARPSLTIVDFDGKVGVFWSADAPCFELQETSSLTSPISWTPVIADVETSGGTNSVTLPTEPGNRFFRLVGPEWWVD